MTVTFVPLKKKMFLSSLQIDLIKKKKKKKIISTNLEFLITICEV